MDTVHPSGTALQREVEDWLCTYPGCGRQCAKRTACFAFHAAAARREARRLPSDTDVCKRQRRLAFRDLDRSHGRFVDPRNWRIVTPALWRRIMAWWGR